MLSARFGFGPNVGDAKLEADVKEYVERTFAPPRPPYSSTRASYRHPLVQNNQAYGVDSKPPTRSPSPLSPAPTLSPPVEMKNTIVVDSE